MGSRLWVPPPRRILKGFNDGGFPQGGAGGSVVTPHIPIAPLGPVNPAGWTTIFADDFLGNTLGPVWFPGGVYTGNSVNTMGFSHTGTPPNPGGTFALNTPSNLAVANSLLTITLKAQTITGDPTVSGTPTNYQWTTGCISSQAVGGATGFTFPVNKRVVLEGLHKIPPAGSQAWPAFWSSSAGVYILEVDDFELVNSATVPQTNVHYVPNGGSFASAQLGPHSPAGLSDLSTAFHVYTVDINWDSQGSITFYLDGVALNTFQVPSYGSSSYGWGIGQTAQMQMIIDMQLFSASGTGLPCTMETDWVHVLTAN